jgi:hypothetical protein
MIFSWYEQNCGKPGNSYTCFLTANDRFWYPVYAQIQDYCLMSKLSSNY